MIWQTLLTTLKRTAAFSHTSSFPFYPMENHLGKNALLNCIRGFPSDHVRLQTNRQSVRLSISNQQSVFSDSTKFRNEVNKKRTEYLCYFSVNYTVISV